MTQKAALNIRVINLSVACRVHESVLRRSRGHIRGAQRAGGRPGSWSSPTEGAKQGREAPDGGPPPRYRRHNGARKPSRGCFTVGASSHMGHRSARSGGQTTNRRLQRRASKRDSNRRRQTRFSFGAGRSASSRERFPNSAVYVPAKGGLSARGTAARSYLPYLRASSARSMAATGVSGTLR